MKILILGGTHFVGRHLVEIGLKRGHEITLFNRGKSHPELFPDVEKLIGDRGGDMEALKGRHWDRVIDPSGMLPRHVRDSATLLADQTEHYTFVSTRSVYVDHSKLNMNEDAPLAELDASIDPYSVTEMTGETYGPLKVWCERAAEQAMPGRVLVSRPGLIVGPYDLLDRFTYWVHRIAQGGEVLAPQKPDAVVTIIDVRDLCEWILTMAEKKQTGIYDSIGPDYPLTMQTILDTCKQVSGSDAHLTWVGEQFLVDEGAQPWMEIPLWIPSMDEQFRGFHSVDISRSLATGLTFRPLAETIRDTLVWDSTRPVQPLRAGLTPEKEKQLLEKWHALGN